MTASAELSALATWTGGILPGGLAGSWLIVTGAVAGVAVALVAALLQLERPAAGLTLLLLAGVLVPVEVPLRGSVLNLCLPLTAFICSCFMLGMFRRRGRSALDGSRVVIATLAFIAVAITSFVVGQYPWFPTDHAPMSAQLGGLGMFLLSGGLFLVVGHQIVTSRQLQRLTWVFVGSGALAVMTSLVSTFDFSLGPITVSNASSIGSAFWTWLVAISLAQALLNRGLSTPMRVAVGGVAACAIARGLLVTISWTSGWLPPLVAACVVLLFRFPRCVIASCLLIVTPALLYGGPALNAWMAAESYSSMTRIEALRVMWQVLQHNPWLGFGPANYYHYTALFPILGWWVSFSSHNNYIDLIGQTGLVGLLAFGWFVAEVLRLALALLPRVPRGFESAYLVGAIAGLAGSLVSGLLADWIVPFTYNIGIRGFRSSLLFWFFLGGVLTLKRVTAATPRLTAAGTESSTGRSSLNLSGFAPFAQSPTSVGRVR
ncbi:MAG: O-antigen ligase family protein [Candidatus Nanopelagicales bacterium]|jgi:hypothetical protein|nr:O-antigen ligase family protein [Candidatus Nanopelagicales bacterium]